MKKDNIILSLAVLGLLIGLALFLTPVLIRYQHESIRKADARAYESAAQEMTEEERLSEQAACEDYNRRLFLFQSGQSPDNPVTTEYETRLIEPPQMAIVEIPKISLKIAVFHYAGATSLSRGAGHLAESSLPVGGESTHAVISAHNGDPYSDSFSQIDKLEVGDRFLVSCNGSEMTYEVDQIRTVTPDDLSQIQIIEGEDHVTLLTCTPRNINSHRLLVRGKRVEDTDASELGFGWSETQILYLLAALVLLAVLLFLRSVRRNLKEASDMKEKTCSKQEEQK